jgi:hypothetical protein
VCGKGGTNVPTMAVSSNDLRETKRKIDGGREREREGRRVEEARERERTNETCDVNIL